MSTISISTLSAIVAMAGLSQFTGISGLTTDQISALLGSIDNQIRVEGEEITRLTSTISGLDTEINTNPNYLRQFTDASGIYWSVSRRYSSLQSTIDQTNIDIGSKQIQLSTLSTQAGHYLSSFNGYDSIYKNLLSSFQSVNVLLLGQIAAYNGEQQQISTLNSMIASTTQQRNTTTTAPTTRTFTFSMPATTQSSRVNFTFASNMDPIRFIYTAGATSITLQYRTTASTTPGSYPSILLTTLGIAAGGGTTITIVFSNAGTITISSNGVGATPVTITPFATFISGTTWAFPLNTLSTYFTTGSPVNNFTEIISPRFFLENTMSSLSVSRVTEEQQASTILGNINTYAQMSTLQALSTGYFQSVFFYWSTMEAYAISSVTGYTTIKDNLVSTQTGLGNEITSLQSQLSGELTTLDTNADNFYTKKKTELLSGVDEMSYALQEYSAGFGYLTSELLIRKLNLDDEIDALSILIQQKVAAGQPSGTDSATRTTKMSDSSQLQDVVTTLNPVETSLRYIVDNSFPIEKTNKENFINLRRDMHNIERQVLEFPSKRPNIQTQYDANWGTLATHITNINTQINARADILFRNTDNVSTKVGKVKERLDVPPLNSYMNGLTIPVLDTSLQMNTIASQLIPASVADKTQPASAYALLPPINFNMSIPPFPTTNP